MARFRGRGGHGGAHLLLRSAPGRYTLVQKNRRLRRAAIEHQSMHWRTKQPDRTRKHTHERKNETHRSPRLFNTHNDTSGHPRWTTGGRHDLSTHNPAHQSLPTKQLWGPRSVNAQLGIAGHPHWTTGGPRSDNTQFGTSEPPYCTTSRPRSVKHKSPPQRIPTEFSFLCVGAAFYV